MNDAFRDLGIGLLFAAVFVYLLMVVNYQNFGDPFVVMLALPATLCGILTMLFITGTTLSVPSLMGAIMAVGVASANSILLVTFAREQQLAGRTAFESALNAGHTRIRPVLMTAAAMIVGMIPMAIGGAGEEQNAALARAVIGGLLFATPTTLLIVPYLFALLRKGNDGKTGHGVFAEDIQSTTLQLPIGCASPSIGKAASRRGTCNGYVPEAATGCSGWERFAFSPQASPSAHGDPISNIDKSYRRSSSVAISSPTFVCRPCGQATG
jgi:hypothetical protein